MSKSKSGSGSQRGTSILVWLNAVPYSRPLKHTIARDFTDGVLIAETIAYFKPTLVNLLNFVPASSKENKLKNWVLLKDKILPKVGIRLNSKMLDDIIDCKTGVALALLQTIRSKVDPTSSHGVLSAQKSKSSTGPSSNVAVNKSPVKPKTNVSNATSQVRKVQAQVSLKNGNAQSTQVSAQVQSTSKSDSKSPVPVKQLVPALVRQQSPAPVQQQSPAPVQQQTPGKSDNKTPTSIDEKIDFARAKAKQDVEALLNGNNKTVQESNNINANSSGAQEPNQANKIIKNPLDSFFEMRPTSRTRSKAKTYGLV